MVIPVAEDSGFFRRRHLAGGGGGGFAVAWVPIGSKHSAITMPLLFCDGAIELSVYAYMRVAKHEGLSASSLSHKIDAIALLAAYHVARGSPALDPVNAKKFYRDLAEAILLGTTGGKRKLPGLFWPPRGSRNATRHLRGIRDFVTFLMAEQGGSTFCPTVRANESQHSIRYGVHLERRKANSLFSHLIDVPHLMARSRVPAMDPMGSRRAGTSFSSKSAPVPFPEKHVVDFFATGLRRRKVSRLYGDSIANNYNVRDLLYFLLLMFGGLRGAEPLHLFVCDVQRDTELGQGTSVFLWHPADGPSPEPHRTDARLSDVPNRQDYLERRFGRVPRSKMMADPQAAGWKNLLLEETVPFHGQRTRVYWQNAAIGQLFWKMHEVYIRSIRPVVVTHPYYFVNLDRRGFGEPWTDASAQNAFSAAMRRMGLQPSSAAGLCRHAMRHRLGYWLAKCGLLPQQIQIVLHHQSLASQAGYTRQQPRDIATALEAADFKREHGVADFQTEDLGLSWTSDPLRLYEGPSEALRARLLRDTARTP